MNEEPQYEKRLLLAFVLSALVFVAMAVVQRWMPHPPAPAAQRPSPVPVATAPSTTAVPPQTSTKPAVAAKQTKPSAASTAAQTAASSEETITLESKVYRVVFSNRGAVVHSWVLKEYTDEFRHPLDVIDPHFSQLFGYPLSFWSGDEGLRNKVNQALFQSSVHGVVTAPVTLEFRWAQSGITVTKRLSFDNSYVVRVETSAEQNGSPLINAIAWPGGFGDRSVIGSRATEQLAQAFGDTVNTFAVKKVNNGQQWSVMPYNFVGVEDQYFAAMFLADRPVPDTVTTFKNSFKPLAMVNAKEVEQEKPVETIGMAVSQGAANSQRLFVGPKQLDLLSTIDPQMRKLVDFGWFTVIAEPLFLWMHWTYDHMIHNYGWVIVFITVVITMAVFPFRLRGQKSQQRMAALQSRIKPLQDKMKRYPMRDPKRQELQQQIMQIYQQEGVNPLGGCLPMLVQLPLIYAFYRVLGGVIELRHQPWIWWIKDLSAPDHTYILPILLIAAQFWMMSMMPPTPGQDATQAKMMKWVMPFFIGFFFFALASGVNLYYLTSNLVYIAQQAFMNKYHPMTSTTAPAVIGKAKRA